MEEILTWFKEHPGTTGYLTASLIFLVTIVMVARKWAGIGITIILLIFSLVSGLAIANQKALFVWGKAAPAQEEAGAESNGDGEEG